VPCTRFMAWKSDQYRRTAVSDRFSRAWVVALLEALLGTEPTISVACSRYFTPKMSRSPPHFGIRSERVMAYWFPAYNASYGAYSPGLIHMLRMVEAAAADGAELVALARGPSITRKS